VRVFDDLRGQGYEGSYDAVQRYAKGWKSERASSPPAAYVPLSFVPGKAYQFDWSHEIVVLGGVTTTVEVAHVRLCHSRMLFVRAYPRRRRRWYSTPTTGRLPSSGAPARAAFTTT